MTRRRDIDYHGSRSYAADRSKPRLWAAIVAWLADRAGRKHRPAIGRTPFGRSPPGTQRGFSLLGNGSRAPQHDPVDWPFPLKSDSSPHEHDWRVLP